MNVLVIKYYPSGIHQRLTQIRHRDSENMGSEGSSVLVFLLPNSLTLQTVTSCELMKCRQKLHCLSIYPALLSDLGERA